MPFPGLSVGGKKNVLKTVWKRIENDDFCEFAGWNTPGQPPGAPDRFPRLRDGKKNEKKTVRARENHKKTMEKENDKKTIKPFFFN